MSSMCMTVPKDADRLEVDERRKEASPRGELPDMLEVAHGIH